MILVFVCGCVRACMCVTQRCAYVTVFVLSLCNLLCVLCLCDTVFCVLCLYNNIYYMSMEQHYLSVCEQISLCHMIHICLSAVVTSNCFLLQLYLH